MNPGEPSGDRVALLLERAVAAGCAPGAVAAVGEASGRVRLWSAGRARIVPAPRPAAPGVLHDLASLTKPLVTTTLFLLARREGLLSLETRVGEVLPVSGERAVAGLTCRQLLTHTSGLPAWVSLYALARGRRERVPEVLAGLELEAAPGSRVVYSCPGFILLGLMLEHSLGAPLQRAFRERIAAPLGLAPEAADFLPDPAALSLAGGARRPAAEEALLRERGLAELRDTVPPVGEGLPDDGNARFLGGAAGNAGLWATAEAVVRLAREYLPSTARLLDREEILLATRNHTEGLEQARGLGWQLAATPGCSAGPGLPGSAFGHTGYTGTSVWVDPVGKRVLVLLLNRHHPGHRDVDLHPLRRRFHALARMMHD